MQVFVETERLALRRFMEADVDHLFALHNDPDVMRFLNGGRPTPHEETEREYQERFRVDGYWAAVEKATGAFLGWFAFHPTQGRDLHEVELGYRLMRSAWGKGYATEGSRALIRKGFTELGVRRVWAQTMAVNLASRRVMEKAGLAYVRTLRLEWEAPLPGAGHGEVEYALTKADWEWRQAAGRGRPRTSTSDSAPEPSATGAGEANLPEHDQPGRSLDGAALRSAVRDRRVGDRQRPPAGQGWAKGASTDRQ